MFRNTITIKMLCCALLILSVTALVRAGEIPLITTPTQVTAGGGYVEYTFCSLSNNPQNIKIFMKSRFPYTSFAGGSGNASITINGKEVQASINRTVGRFLSDNLTSPVTSSTSASWFHQGYGWYVIYAPSGYPTYPSFYTHNPYYMEIDISDMVNTDTTSTIRITNTNPDYAMEIPDLRIITYNYTGPVSPTLDATASMVLYGSNGELPSCPAAYSYSVLAGGGFTVTENGRTWSFATHMSYPNSSNKYDKLVPLGTVDTTGETGWTVTKNGNTITAQGTTFAITRNFQFTPSRIIVTDQITNRTSTAKALILKHNIDLSNQPNPLVHIAGNPDPSIPNYSSSGNPSIHVATGGHGMGMTWDDDVTRAHANMYFSLTEPTRINPPTTYYAGMQDNMLRIPGNGSYTTVWSVYPINSPKYYDFVNIVRQEWGANFTVDGGYCWFDAHTIAGCSIADINYLFAHNGIKYAFVTGGLLDIDNADPLYVGFGMAINDNYWSSYRSTIRTAAANIRSANSTYGTNTKVGIYHDTQHDTSGYTYDSQNPFNYTNPFSNSNKRTNSDGSSPTVYFGYNLHPYAACMVPITGNSYATAISGLLDCFMLTADSNTHLGLDCIYWDELEDVNYGTPLLTYNNYDGNSCIINSSFGIGQECGVVALLSKQFNLSGVDKIKGYGAALLGNSPHYSKDMLNTHMPRFVEAQHPGYMFEPFAHFSTPLANMITYLGTFADVVTILDRGCLPVWSDFNHGSYDIFRYQWPMTVMELQSGYILGQERIITTHNGTYGWRAGCSMIQVHRFDSSGVLVSSVDAYPTTIPGSTTVVSSLPSTNVVVLERLPITLDPRP